jgi:hypothetical protein
MSRYQLCTLLLRRAHVEHLSPRALQRGHRCAGAPGNVGHPLAKDAVHAHDHLVAWLNEVDHAGFHAGTTGTADRKGQAVGRSKSLPQELLHLIHDLQELRVQVADEGRGHRRQNARMNVAGAWPHEDARRRVELAQKRHGDFPY